MTPSKATITKTASTATTVTVYAKAKNAEIYQYRLSASKYFKKNVKKGATTAKHFKFKSLKKNKKHYVKVRAVADKTGKWSKVKSVKTKKTSTTKTVTLSDGKIWGFQFKVIKKSGVSYGRLIYKWKNTSKCDNIPAYADSHINAYQSDIRLNPADRSDNFYTQVRSGKTVTVYRDFELRSTTKPVKVLVQSSYPYKTLLTLKYSI